MRDRAQADLIGVMIFFVTVLVALWIFTIVAPPIIDALVDMSTDIDAVEEQGYSGTVDRYHTVVLQQAPTILGGGFIVLIILFAVFRERFLGAGGRRR
ncbi:hypothetical protein [Natranaeroarchaeum sulfidigenes]|uniref:Uncharacterized protein n=1 Tax=Natranaeroarchaeum sulfidigenes TaxID=2784880 RepID=A0A897MWJ2_9EURY|nr:hypothetical protein [Natranaeroarchaeum sulfidigenes]QSG02526.1 hypothetical protein AArcS_1309 [Natranaeroarchaeum sulfidigenes]